MRPVSGWAGWLWPRRINDKASEKPCWWQPWANSSRFSIRRAIGLFVNAKDQDAKRYYEQFGFVSMPTNSLELLLPVKTIQEALDEGA